MLPQPALVRLGLIKLGETDLAGILDQVVTLARETLPGVGAAALTIVDENGPSAVGSCRADRAITVPMRILDDVAGTLTVCGDDMAVPTVEAYAAHASVVIANAYLYDRTAGLAHQMQAAMESRAIIEQAKGIVMAERRCSADEAFAILTRISQNSNRKLRDLAAALVARTILPGPEPGKD